MEMENLETLLGVDLRLKPVLEAIRRQLETPGYEERPYLSLLCEIFEVQRDHQVSTRRARNHKKAGFKYPSFDLLDIKISVSRGLDIPTMNMLKSLRWLNSHQNLIITGPAGVGLSLIHI